MRCIDWPRNTATYTLIYSNGYLQHFSSYGTGYKVRVRALTLFRKTRWPTYIIGFYLDIIRGIFE